MRVSWNHNESRPPAGVSQKRAYVASCTIPASNPGTSMPVLIKTVLLLVAANVFMTFAWYAHLKNLGTRPLVIAVLASWGIAFIEYCFQVPANRIGHTAFDLPKLKILQEVITLSVFVPFAVVYMKQPVKMDFLWAALCLCGAVYFVFRS
jgi:uncharacterized protein (DUF486 family)